MLQETIRSFRPDLIERDSVEYAALIAAEAAGVRHGTRVKTNAFSEMLLSCRLVCGTFWAQRSR